LVKIKKKELMGYEIKYKLILFNFLSID